MEAEGDLDLIDAVSNHVSAWIGPVGMVLHETSSEHVHVDVHLIKATEERPFHVCVTTGLAERPMVAGPDSPAGLSAELILCLPWYMAFKDIVNLDEAKLPIAFLRLLARYPHAQNTLIWDGHTIKIPDSYRPPSEPFVAGLLTKPYLFEPSGSSLEFKDRRIYFHQLAFLTQSELAFKNAKGADALLDLAEDEYQLEDLLIFSPGREPLTL